MKLNLFTIAALIPIMVLIGCQNDMATEYIHYSGKTTISISLAESRTSLGEKSGKTYPTYWTMGDCISVNGIKSNAVLIDAENASRATFEVDGVLAYPYAITYPHTASSTKESPKVVFATEQHYTEGSFDNGSAPMCGYVEMKSNTIALRHLAGILRFALRSEVGAQTVLKSVTITSPNALSGEFAVNCQDGTISPTENSNKSITYSLPENFSLSADVDRYIYIAVPHGNIGLCNLVFKDSEGITMKAQWNGSSVNPGIVREFKSIAFRETKYSVMLENMRENIVDEWGTEPGVTVKGYIRSDSGKPLEGVVVSDGLLCTSTNVNGFYSLKSDLANAKFVMASIPSGYSAPTNENGLPIFYHRITDSEKSENICVADFSFNKIMNNAERYTLLVGADPQPRARTVSSDCNAYHSLDCCEDLYRDMREKAATISGHNVYGLMLGDIVHEDMSLYDNYLAGLSTLGFPMFNVLGNHDNDPTAANDVEGRRVFEEKIGPTYYSFNIGKQHFVVLDNLIMKARSSDGSLREYDQGLTDEVWQWLQNDLSYVDTSTTLMIAVHSPMTKLKTGGSRNESIASHFTDYTTLFAKYKAAHIWSGHTHESYNYCFASTHELYGIEEHTVARSTGELWTNEYIAGGTPRGYTVVEVDGDNISWKFKPTIYQSGSFVSTRYTEKRPSYIYRDWDYNSNGIAKMRSNGATLSESYQMKVYVPGTYNESFADMAASAATNDYIYVNVFLWDSKWQNPKFDGIEMEHVSYRVAYALDEYEIRKHYCTYGYTLSNSTSYEYTYDKDNYIHTLFRIKAPSATGKGTVTVTDRFGNEYSSSISW